jgi:ribosomal protein uS4
MKKSRKKYEKPVRRWDKERIEKEKELLKKFGLRRKKEIWRAEALLRKFRRLARKLIASPNKEEEKILIKKLASLGILKEDANVNDVLRLNVEDILKRRLEKKWEKTTEEDEELRTILESRKTQIKVVGCGGAGNNTITRLMQVGIVGAETIAINTDAQDLLYTDADKKVLIGKELTGGLGAGADPSTWNGVCKGKQRRY